jgi:Domain of unknown function(DUF2779)
MSSLTKTQLAEFEQCPKRFWLAMHRPELAEPLDPSAFAVGNAIGAIARANIPNGILVNDRDRSAALARTQDLLAAVDPTPIFEAAFEHDGVYVRVDVLTPSDDGWRLAEVKSSTTVKDYQIPDLATQVWAAQGAGLALADASIRLVDTSFVYSGDGNYLGLLKDVSGGAKLAAAVGGREPLVRAAEATAAGDEPKQAVGSHCSDPFECPFTRHCHAGLPPAPEFPVELLPGKAGKATAAKLQADGISDLRAAPREAITAANELRMYDASCSGEAFHDREAILAVVQNWAFPRYFLDFETVGPTIPLWAGTRPYQAIPFQFSCHVQSADGATEHLGFLDVSGADPRRACAEQLLRVLGKSGAIVTYNLATEKAAITGLANACPEMKEALLACCDRLVDALPLVRAHYYHPQMKGSFSIKAVLPAVAPTLSYADLDEVADGLAAGRAYVEAVHADTGAERRDELREKLWAYCRLDTLAMVELVGVLCGPPGPAETRR